jgi:microsomal epoxide hydrolase
LNVPTLIIASTKSFELSRQQTAANQIPHAVFEKIDDTAHAVFIDQPDRFDELLTSFVAKPAKKILRPARALR